MAREHQRLDDGCREGADVRRGKDLGQVDQLLRNAQVRLVRSIAIHGVVPGHDRDLTRPLASDELSGVEDGGGHERQDVLLGHERRLDVELRELELAIGTQVLVTHASGDLVVAIEPTDHQQLLGQLRALGQHIERTMVQPARHGELTRPLRRRSPEQWRLHLDEPLSVHRCSQGAVDRRSDAQVALHPRTAKIEKSMAQPDLLVDLGTVVEAERWGLRSRQHLDRTVTDLDLTRGQLGVDGPVGPVTHGAGHLEDVLAAHVDRSIDDALDDSRVVAQVNEGQMLAVLASTTNPPADAHGGPDVRAAERAAQDIAQGCGLPIQIGRLAHPMAPVVVTCVSSAAISTVRCSASWRSIRMVTDADAASSAPMIRAIGVPDRSAAFICAFIDRPS